MNENKSSHTSQTSISLNQMNSPINLKFSFLQPDKINGINNNHDILKKKSIEKHTQQQLRKNAIRTRSENFFKQYDFGVPRYHEFNPKCSYVKVKNFLNEKIIDEDLKNSNIKNQNSQQQMYNDLYLDDKNICKYTNNSLNNKLLSNRNYINADYKNNNQSFKDKKDSKSEEDNNESSYKIVKFNDLKEDKNNFPRANKTNLSKSIQKLNFNCTKIKDSSKSSNVITNLSYKILNVRDSNKFQNEVSVNDNKAILRNKRDKINLHINDPENFLNDNLSNKDIRINNSNKNLRNLTSEKSHTLINSNNMLQNSINDINEYEDILEDKLFKRNINSHRNSSKEFSFEKKNKNEITNLTFKNSNTSFSKDYNITFLKRQNEKEKNVIYEINRLKMGSDIPQISKQFYLLNYNEALEKEKIKEKDNRIKNTNLPKEHIRTLTQTNFKNLFMKNNHGNYLKFENEFFKETMKNKIREDKLKDKRNFNYNFDSEKYSTAVHLNNLLNFPVIISDPKIFEEILNRNTNNILQRGKKLTNK